MSTDEKIGPECFGGTDYPDLPLDCDPFARPALRSGEPMAERREAEQLPHGMPRMLAPPPRDTSVRGLLGLWLDGPPESAPGSMAGGSAAEDQIRRDWYTRRRDDALALLPDAANRVRALLLAIVNHADAVRSGRS